MIVRLESAAMMIAFGNTAGPEYDVGSVILNVRDVNVVDSSRNTTSAQSMRLILVREEVMVEESS